ncbi:MAG: hypothetical protein K2X32_08180 [Phycisphaerales bacterium]|nr:hypothetical protein [Phycisphaerales bacterium]
MNTRATAMLALGTILVLAGSAAGQQAFELVRKTGHSVVVTTPDAPVPSAAELGLAKEARRAKGIVAELTKAQVQQLIATVDRAAAPALAPATPTTPATPAGEKATASTVVCVLHVSGAAGTSRISISQAADGAYAASDVTTLVSKAGKSGGGATTSTVSLKAELLDRLLGDIGYLGSMSVDSCTDPRQRVFEAPHPYQHGPVTFDAKTIADRMGTGGHYRFEPVTRNLAEEKFWTRLPKGYDPSRAWGLVVWADASSSGKPPGVLETALDDLGLVCIGAAEAGNDRDALRRVQLALDAMSTARRRYNIDGSRVYLAGISGGSRIANLTQICFPEHFAGALCFVGLVTYQDIPTGDGTKIWGALCAKPSGKRWQQLLTRKIAAVTGSGDFNRTSVLATVKLFQRDKLNARLWDIEGMGHTFPTPEQIREQLEWIEERGSKGTTDPARPTTPPSPPSP